MSNDYIEVVFNETEVVDTDGDDSGQPWKNRIRAGNHFITWGTETFHMRESAHASVEALGRMFSPSGMATLYPPVAPAAGEPAVGELHVWLDAEELGPKHVIEVRLVAELADSPEHV